MTPTVLPDAPGIDGLSVQAISSNGLVLVKGESAAVDQLYIENMTGAVTLLTNPATAFSSDAPHMGINVSGAVVATIETSSGPRGVIWDALTHAMTVLPLPAGQLIEEVAGITSTRGSSSAPAARARLRDFTNATHVGCVDWRLHDHPLDRRDGSTSYRSRWRRTVR